MSRRTKSYVTPAAYLADERRSEHRSEYFDGEVVAMTGASRKHNLIALNVAAELRAQLRGRDCETYVSDMRVRIPSANIYTYPDVVVVCGEPSFEDAEVDTLLNPTLIVEVLSKSTADYDREAKFTNYRTLSTLTEYFLVSQDERHVTRHARQPDGRWLASDVSGPDDSVELSSVGCVLRLREIYERVEV
ncbi:MAG TPA: Uma2 family endonuclease [Pyrinomonadaceae bacterium]|nr:Uma2 family endonuclease [Pyrinomonadaceae bacterium]